MAQKKTSSKAKSPKEAAEKNFVSEVLREKGLPKGEVINLLKGLNVDKAIIDQAASGLVPYGYT